MNFIFIFIALFMPKSSDSDIAMNAFHNLGSEKKEVAFLKKYGSSKDPSILAYVVTMEIKQAEYALNPFRKWGIFKEGKAKLEELISKNPENLHLRYVRYLIQKGAPSFLGYTASLDEDAAKLKSYLSANLASDSLSTYIRKNCSL